MFEGKAGYKPGLVLSVSRCVVGIDVLHFETAAVDPDAGCEKS